LGEDLLVAAEVQARELAGKLIDEGFEFGGSCFLNGPPRGALPWVAGMKKELEERVEISRAELDKYAEHIDRFMHKYISPILRIDAALNMQRKMLETIHIIPFRKDDSVSEVSGDDLEVGISMAVDALQPLEDAAATILGEELLRLRNILSRRHLYEDSPIEHVTTRGVAMGVPKALDRVPLEGPDHTLDALATYATGIVTAAVERSIMITLSETEGLKTIIENLRRHISWAAVEYDFRVMNVVRLVARSIELYAPMAAEEKRRMIMYSGPRELSAEIADVHINRMISNMLLNAIKYSHLGRRDHSDPIEVRVEDKGNAFSISTWNYGVPIKRQEIESKKIYGFGYRGELSKDYNRNGSGIGLADMSETAEAHKGYVKVTSVSTDEGADPEDYSRPFETIVKVTLPKYRSGRR